MDSQSQLRIEVQEPPTAESRQVVVDNLLAHFTEEYGEAEAYALEHGGVAAHLECAADALPFYQRCGYELVGVMEDFPVPGERQHFVRKWLDTKHPRTRI